MKLFFTTCLFAFSWGHSFLASAQCGAAGIGFPNQASINNFTATYPGCTQILGDVAINGADITNVNGLSGVTSVGGYLAIQNNPALASLAGLAGVTSVSEFLYIEYNPALPNLSGLSSIASVGENLTIGFNPVLTSLIELSGVTTVGGSLSIVSLPLLTSLTGLHAVTSVGDQLAIDNNPLVTTLTPLSNITSVGNSLIISRMNMLTNLNGLAGVTTLSAGFNIEINASLTSLSVLSGLTNAPYVNVLVNAALTSLTGLENINPATIVNLTLRNSSQLSVCNLPNICTYLSTPANPANIFGNAANCASRAAILAGCPVLPVELISFTGKQSGRQHLLEWTTATEINSACFDLERSANGVSFELIGTIQGAGSMTNKTDYNYTNRRLYNGLNYYRLKLVDTDGKFEYSDLITINNPGSDKIRLYPNPVTSELYLDGLKQPATYTITNTVGQIMQAGSITPDQPIKIASFSRGLYFICFDNQALKFLKQ